MLDTDKPDISEHDPLNKSKLLSIAMIVVMANFSGNAQASRTIQFDTLVQWMQGHFNSEQQSKNDEVSLIFI